MSAEFGVHSVDQTGESEFAITGRVFSGTIDRQTCFSALLEYGFVSPEVATTGKVVGDISAKVVKISCYHREVDCLEEGLTGVLIVTGSGIDQVSPGLGIATDGAVVSSLLNACNLPEQILSGDPPVSSANLTSAR
ncbi:MAG: hypothetical protein EOP88_16075 [Verrucomicrobiaceae bacterium]|nr:MAG: hypothetical protein EOP88_16075 [Verrucomicrobiaceae bacterium]